MKLKDLLAIYGAGMIVLLIVALWLSSREPDVSFRLHAAGPDDGGYIYMLACPIHPQGIEPTEEQVKAGECPPWLSQ